MTVSCTLLGIQVGLTLWALLRERSSEAGFDEKTDLPKLDGVLWQRLERMTTVATR